MNQDRDWIKYTQIFIRKIMIILKVLYSKAVLSTMEASGYMYL